VASGPKPLDPRALYGLAGDIVRAVDPYTEAALVALLAQLLVTFGSMVGRGPYFVAEGARHYLNLFLVLVGLTAKGRKGSSLARVLEVGSDVDPEWAARCRASGLSSGEGLIHAVRDPLDGPPREDGAKDSGVTDKRLLVYEPEFASTLRILQRQGNTLSAIVRGAWDSGELRSLTKGSPVSATGAHISIIGHITADEVLRYLDRTEIANGFGNRFLWVWVERSKLLPEGGQVPHDTLVDLRSRLRAARDFARDVQEMRRDEDARRLWRREYAVLSEGRSGMSGALTARAEAQVTRLSCIYALLDSSAIVRLEHLRAALALWSYCAGSVRHVFGDELGDPLADEIRRGLLQAAEGLDRTAIHRLLGNHRSRDAVDRALALLLQLGLASPTVRESDGRSAEVWRAREANEGASSASFAGSTASSGAGTVGEAANEWGHV
jgi:hypothetical protein